jgi:peptidoglycan/xylan/chitin deacetylase (PgdA/CDA1 family)
MGPRQPTVAVLCYHSVAARTSPRFADLSVEPSLFGEQIAALQDVGLDVIPFADVPDALASRRRAVAITIDDGLADAADNACPALAAHGMTATLFVPTGYVGARSGWLRGADAERPMLSWETIASLADQGFELGSHGQMHLAADVNAGELVQRDARASRLELEDHIGRPVSSFAYPFGYHSHAARRAVRAAGYRQACAVGELPARAHDDRWALPRMQIRSHTTPEDVVEIATWTPSPVSQVWARSKQRVWQIGRRFSAWGPAEAGRVQGALQ